MQAVVTKLQSLGEHDDIDYEQYEIKNGDLVAVVTTYGATLLSLKYKGQEMTLNWENLEDLINKDKNPKYGATCGRVAGRISKAKFEINGEQFELEANNGPNCLHGGTEGFDNRVWKAKQC